MKRLVYTIFVLMTACHVHSQDLTHSSNEVFRSRLDAIVSKGNLFYDVDNKNGIKLMADSLASAIAQRGKAGQLDKTDSLEYMADWHKLMGSYFYEESYYEPTAYVKAKESYSQALTIYQNTPEFRGYLDKEPLIHREFAQLYYKEGKYELALEHIKMAFDAFSNAADLQEIDVDDPEFLDIQTQLALCQARVGFFEEADDMMDKLIDSYDQQDVTYGEALRKKAKILMLQEEHGVKASRTEALNCYKQYFALKKEDALNHFMGMGSDEREQYWMHVRPFVTDCYRLEDADAGFLYDVTLFAKGLLLQLDSAGGGRQDIHATWQMIQEHLKPDACAIEFIQYEKYGQQQMGALVLKKVGEPIFVKMEQPDSVMNYKVNNSFSIAERLGFFRNNRSKGDHNKINGLYNDSTGFFNFIWNSELINTIGNSHDVWFAPDGYIHQLAVEYMMPQQMAHVSCHRLSSTRVLLTERIEPSYHTALIIGGIDYDAKCNTQGRGNDEVAYHYVFGKGNNCSFAPLNNSLIEARGVRKVRNCSNDLLLEGTSALEPSVRKECVYYSLIHISSHGVFNAASVPQGTDLKYNLRDNTLSHSFIALAGVNYNLKSEGFDASCQDGILSAREIASLDLSKADLVVLCCCETGLGFVTPDGLYGIQRGLKNAGAKATICTLWDIDDEASCFFMLQFHQNLNECHDLYKAFYRARDAMKEQFDEPSYRDAFILIDAI